MRSLSVRFLLSLFVLVLTPAVFAHDITITGTQNFASLDGSASDHDGTVNGVFTVSDGNLTVNGVVNCNDDTTTSACSMAFVVSGNMTINSGGALYAENRTGSGIGGAITLTVGGNLALNGNAIVSTASKSSSGSTGGAITANAGGSVALASGTTIDSGAANAAGGAILINGGSIISVDGNVLSGPSRTILSTRLTGAALDGGTSNSIGGAITISSATFAEPALTVSSTANIISQGSDGGAGPVRLDACGIQIKGLVAALSTKDSAAKVAIRSGKDVLIDGRDLGGSGTRMGRVRADAPTGTAINKGVDVFAGETVDLFGPASGTLFLITSIPGQHDSKSYGGLVRIMSLEDAVNGSGNLIDNGHSASGDTGGTVEISAKGNANLNTAVIESVGDFNTNNSNRGGGSISVRSYSGDVIWTNGSGDVRPVGSASGLVPADQGKIVLTACGTVSTTGSSFPSNGTPTSPLPETHTGVCSPGAPSLPSGVPPLVTCNTPPVANDTSATTNEDTTVTITLSGSDADGDSLTFTIVSGPSNGVLGPVISTGPTTATVNYTPNLNFNGTDSFVFQANDGNGGTDTATATITVIAVNDPPTFQIGPTINVLEDSGPQTFASWVTAISPGPADESGQTVTFSTSNSSPPTFSAQPSVASSGTLTFTPAPNANGGVAVTVTAQDNGGTANGGNDTSAPQNSNINVIAVNDEPSFAKGPDQTVNEDAGPQTVSGWATAITAGPNEGGQALTFVTSNNNNSLFSAQPAVAPDGTLTYTPAANAFGSATVTVYLTDNGGTSNGGDDTSPSQTFTITVNSVNDAPSFTSGGNVTVNEDSGAYSATWATAVSAGPANESSQTVTFNVVNDNNALFSVQPSIDSSGVLTFTPVANAFGTANVTVTLSDNGGIANGGVDTSAAQNFTIAVNAVNDEPSFTAGGDVTVNEDSGAYSATWATAISAGPNEGSQTLTFNVSNDNNALFSSQPAIDAGGTLTFTLAADAFGTATVSVYLMDDGGIANGGDDTSPTATFTLTVNAVNDAPSFTSGGNVTVNEDSGAYSAAWATAVSAGPANESGQALTFNITGNTNPAIFASGPSISASGVLSFMPAANAFGSATITVTLSDDGGVANGGVDTSAPQSFTITVNSVNDAPSFTPGGDVTVNEDSGPYAATWATSISAGPANESGQAVNFVVTNNNNALFLVQPSISPTGVLTFTSNPNANGSAIVSVTLHDNGGIANGGVDTSATVQFTINVTAVNDPPTANADAWDTLGNTELRVDFAGGLTPKVTDTTASGNGVRDNDSDPEGDPFVVSGIVGCSDVTAPFDCTLPDGSVVAMLANGSFSYTPGPGNTTGSFQYTLTDIPVLGSPASSTGTVNITIYDRIWYVNGSAAAGGNGTSIAPFTDFASINGAGGAGDSDSTGDHIFVHSSNVSGGIELEGNQHLLGEGVGLSINQNLNGNGAPVNLVPAGAQPNVSNSGGNAVSITAALPIEVRGLSLAGTADAIDLTSSGSYTFSPSLLISSNTIRSAGLEGIDVNAGAGGSPAFTISNNVWDLTGPHSSNGIDIRSSLGSISVDVSGNTNVTGSGTGILIDASAGGSITVTDFSGNSVHGNTGNTGIAVTSAIFDQTPGGAFNTVAGGNTNVGAAGNAVPVGFVMTSVTGDLGFGTLNVYSGAGMALRAVAGGSGFRLATSSGIISAVGGTAVDMNAVNMALQFADVSGSNSSTAGVSMVNSTGTFNAPAGSITNATGADFNINGGTATVTYGGSISDDVGTLVSVANATGGTTTFNGAITDGNDGDGSGITLTNDGGATVNFNGQLTLSTGANAAFTATGGGVVNASAANNTVATTTGTAVNISSPSNIGGSGVKFQSVTVNNGASNSAANAIILNGTTGSFNVTGDGSTTAGLLDRDGSGGTINRTTGHSVLLTNASNVTLRQMNITNSATNFDGVNSTGGSNIVLSAMNFDTPGRNGWGATNVGGVSSVDNNSRFFGWNTNNASGVVVDQNVSFTSFTVDNSLFSTSATGADGFLFDLNAGSGTVTVTDSEFTLIDQDGVQINNDGSGTLTAIVQRNNFHDADSTGGDGNNTLFLWNAGSSTLNFTVGGATVADGNSFTNLGRLVVLAGVIQVNATTSSQTGTRLVGTIQNNTISGSTGRRGIDVGLEANGGAHGGHDVTIDNNSISNMRKQGINVTLTSINGGDITGNAFRIRNNVLTNVGQEGNTDSGSGIEFENNSATAGGDFGSNVIMQNNQVSNSNSSGVGSTLEVNNRSLFAGDTNTLNLTLWGNSLTNGNASGEVLEVLNTGSAGTQTLCLDMNGQNIAANANSYTGGGAAGFKLTNNFGTYNIGFMSAGAQTAAAVQTFVSARNNSQTVTAAGAGGFSGSPGGCTQP